MFWVISVYFNVRNILPKSGTFPPGHPVCEDNTKTDLRIRERGLVSSGTGYGPVTGSFESGNEVTGSINGAELAAGCANISFSRNNQHVKYRSAFALASGT